MEYTDQLRRLTLNDTRLPADLLDGDLQCTHLDPKTLALVRLAALIGVGGALPSFAEHVDVAVAEGASAPEIVEVLLGVVPVVGLPRVVAAAPNLALALGYDTDDAFAE